MILVFGTICLDRVRSIDRLPPPGGYVSIQSETWMLGGEAANTAHALLHWGSNFEFAGNDLGAGTEGDRLLHMLDEAGLPTKRIHKAGPSTPVCDVYVTSDGERTMFGLGFDQLEDSALIEELPFAQGGFFTTDMNWNGLGRIAVQEARSAGMRPYVMDFVEPTDTFEPGDYWQSSTDWLGKRGDEEHNLEFVSGMSDRFGCNTILTDGPNGIYVAAPNVAARHYPAFPTPAFVDATGAGDMFRAGMLNGLDRDWPLAKCLEFASAAGSLKCQWYGATSRVPTLQEIQNHQDSHAETAERYK